MNIIQTENINVLANKTGNYKLCKLYLKIEDKL